MAKVETRQLPEGGKFTNTIQVIRALRGAIADEMSAQNLYSEIIEYAKSAGNTEGLVEAITEIMNDEMQHAGKLLWCINQIDGTIGDEMQKGAQGG